MTNEAAVSRVLCGNPKLLLLDEPSEGTQPNIVQEIGSFIRELVESRDISVLIVEQNLELIGSSSPIGSKSWSRVSWFATGQRVSSEMRKCSINICPCEQPIIANRQGGWRISKGNLTRRQTLATLGKGQPLPVSQPLECRPSCALKAVQ